ncbi:MAG: tetratricopeptide repeat protein [Planctomycetota bacterium]
MRLLLLALVLALMPVSGGGENPFLEKQIAAANRLLEAGKVAEARVEIERALERDHQHLGALRMWADVCVQAGDKDTAAYAMHSWLEVVYAAEKSSIPKKTIKEVESTLAGIDIESKSFRKLTDSYIKELLKLQKEHVKKGRYHSALAILDEVLHIDPGHPEGLKLYKEIQRHGGADVATEDLYAGTDPTAGVDAEWIAEEDAKHSEWKDAWRKETEYYRIRTNAGYLVLQTAGIAMDQMNLAYRRFFQYKEDGGSIPKIDVHVFKNRDEYLTMGQGPPVEWSAGHFTGNAVETYIGGTEGTDGIREMYSTLFHEAAHQFVSLTGKGGVPGWLNEAYASFFEGTTILSNGSVRWNRVNNGRLFALAPRLEEGWMSDHTDGIRDANGEWGRPTKAPSLRILIENEYQWGPPWYAPTWGVVYFLYNYRDPETGRAVLRAPLHEYYLSGAASVGLSRRVEHFEEMVLAGDAVPAKTVDELNEIWAEWLLTLRDRQIGQGDPEDDLLQYVDKALDRGDSELALELLEEALLYAPDNPETQWEMAKVLEEVGELDRASSMYRSFAAEMELRGTSDDPRYEQARKLMEELDPLFQKHKKLKLRLGHDGLDLAKSYRNRQMPRMAMEIARRMSASWSMPEALAFYTEVAMESGISLARWRIAYNELTLDGWQPNKAYQAYGKMVDVFVVDDPAIETPPGSFQTQELAADVSFDADFSIESEMRFGKEPSFMGLCFGRKDGRNTHAVGLYPKGALDVATKAGGNWTTRDHQQVNISPGWHKLRIDVVTQVGPSAVVDIYFDDLWLRSIEMPRDSVRGGFGLITGTGDGHFRNIRILERDPHDPAARIERELGLKQRLEDPSSRSPGVFQGVEPPNYSEMGGYWLQNGPLDLVDRYGHPTVVAFWTPHQDDLIPTSEYYDWLVDEWKDFDLQVVTVVTNSHSGHQIREWLTEHPMEKVHVLYDEKFKIYPAYNVGQGGWEIPRILLIDVDGTVAWEGDPNLSLDQGWTYAEQVQTPLDHAIESLITKRALRELNELAKNFDKAMICFEDGRLRAALKLLNPLAELDADFDIRVQDARALIDTIEGIGAELPVAAEDAAKDGRPLTAHAMLTRAVSEFPGTGIADLSASRLRKLERTDDYRKASKAWKSLTRAAADAEKGREAEKIATSLDKAAAASDCVEIQEAVTAMRDALLKSGVSAVEAAWKASQPTELELDY